MSHRCRIYLLGGLRVEQAEHIMRQSPNRAITVLAIAGSDSGGGAGIQASLRTFAALGVFGACAVTAITAQDSRGVRAVWPVPADQIAAQLEAVALDYCLGAVQIGMLGSAAAVEGVADFLERFHPPNVVLDPVLAASSGAPLLDPAGRARLIDRLLPLAHLVTPNLPEAAILSGIEVGSDTAIEAAARWFLDQGARAVLLKGGHRAGKPLDLLLQTGERGHETATRALWLGGERAQVPLGEEPSVPAASAAGSGVHGTGCVLAAAIAARLSQGLDLVAAVREGRRFVEAAIRGSAAPGHGRPCAEPLAGTAFSEADGRGQHSARLDRLRGIYVVTDSRLRPDRDAASVAAAAVAGGACAVQLREKRLPTPAMVALARRLADEAAAAGVLFLVNDRVDVALAAGADGVHIGPDDMPPADARRLLGPERLLGVSVGTVEEARAAAPYASYFGVGAIFGSRTKADAGPAVTPARIAEIGRAVPDVPIVAIGGIDAVNVAQVAAAGASAAAVVSAVVMAQDMAAAVRDLAERFHAGAPPLQ